MHVLAWLLATVPPLVSRKLSCYWVIRGALEVEHARVRELCPSGRRWYSKGGNRKYAIIKALTFRKVGVIKIPWISGGGRKGGCTTHLPFTATGYVLLCPFHGLANTCTLVLSGLFGIQVSNNVRIGQDDRKVSKWKESRRLREWNSRRRWCSHAHHLLNFRFFTPLTTFSLKSHRSRSLNSHLPDLRQISCFLQRYFSRTGFRSAEYSS